MDCEHNAVLLDGYIDLELDPAQAAEFVAHTRECPRCAQAVAERQKLRSSLASGMQFHPAPPSAAASFNDAFRLSLQSRRAASPRWAWASLAACLLLTGALLWSQLVPRSTAPSANLVMRDAVSSHLRSLMAAHLTDVPSTDQHTVKPWFAGKIDFSPPVRDFASDGFPLIGGRLDYIADRPAAAMVYQRRAHVINLFACADQSIQSATSPKPFDDRGIHAFGWTEPGMRFCAVSDLNADELQQFVTLVRAPAR